LSVAFDTKIIIIAVNGLNNITDAKLIAILALIAIYPYSTTKLSASANTIEKTIISI
jgi:hypothetical protein